MKERERYGVVNIDKARRVVDINEKPNYSESNWAITGFNFYANRVLDVAS